MIILILASQLFLALYNIGNVNIDAYKIMENKTIAHSVNFILYGVFVAALAYIMHMQLLSIGFFCASGFLNRQFSFDIPLNLQRGLDWYYQTKAVGKKASLLDKIERSIFGSADDVGKKIFKVYLFLYCLIIMAWVLVA